MKLFLIIYLLAKHVSGLRTRESWENILRSATLSHYGTEDKLIAAQTDYLQRIERTKLPHPFVVKYSDKCGQLCHDDMKRLVGTDVSHYDIINSDHALLHLDCPTMRRLATSKNYQIQDYAPLLPNIKMDANVLSQSACSAEGSAEVVPYHVVLLPINADDIRALIRNVPAEWNTHILLDPADNRATMFMDQFYDITPSPISNTVLISTPCAIASGVVEYLSAQNFVQWIEVRPDMNFFSEWANGITQSGDDTMEVLHAANLTGLDEVIGIADTGVDTMSCFFHDPEVDTPYDRVDLAHRKVIYYDTYADDSDSDGHGTLVSGTAAGRVVTGDALRVSNGAAYRSKLSFFDIGKANGALTLPANINSNLFTVLYDTGARVQSMSWGSTSSKYTNDARNVDIFMWEHPTALVLVAAGNSGANGAGSIGSPATNKNGVAVGANLNSESSFDSFGIPIGTDYFNEDSLAYFSSRGPTQDGRTKPDVTGVGWFITGAKSEYPVRSSQHCSSSASMGTSFSCPLLAGHVALAREYFRTGYYPSGYRNVADGFEPSGALLKAVLIHGAERLKQVQLSDGGIESTGIDRGDNNQGYGRSQLNNVLSFNVNATLEGLTFFAVGAAYNTGGPYAEMKASDSPHEYKFTTGSASNLKPIRITLAYTDYYAVAGAANVMINDLDLMMTDGTDTYYPVITNLDGKYDRLNNVEAIILFNPPANTTFTVTVTGHSISTTQPYALIISGEVGQFPYSKDDSNWLLYILGALLILIFGGCCVLTISACISKKKAIDKKKPHAVAQDPNTPDVMHQSSRGDV